MIKSIAAQSRERPGNGREAMEQATFAELEHDSRKRRTRREAFLEKMDDLVPWEALEALVEPFHPKPGGGRRPYPLRTMLRMHCVHLFHNMSDPGAEAAERRKASVQAKLEHPFLCVKRHFSYSKAHCRGLARNRRRIALLLGFANLLIAGCCATG